MRHDPADEINPEIAERRLGKNLAAIHREQLFQRYKNEGQDHQPGALPHDTDQWRKLRIVTQVCQQRQTPDWRLRTPTGWGLGQASRSAPAFLCRSASTWQ